jgi:hypothetical protein
MEESDFKRDVVKAFKGRGCYARRIEDLFSVGFPDLVLAIPDCPVFFTEAKIIRKLYFGPTPRQYVELKRLSITRHSQPTLLGFDGSHTYIHPYAERAYLGDCLVRADDEHIVDFFIRYDREKHTKWPTNVK